jgi:hypothetical protein
MTYNAAHYLPQLCRSIQAQTYRNFEVVILDDGSTDGTRSVLAAFEKDPRFRVFVWKENRGVAAAFREVVSKGTGDYWICTGADDVLFPDFLERRLALMQAHPNAVLVHGAPEFIDESGKAIPSPFRPLRMPPQLNGKRALEMLLQHNVINAPSALVRYEVTRKLWPFYQNDLKYAEDWHLWILHLAEGHEVLWDERPANNYRVHGQSISCNPKNDALRRAATRLTPLCALKAAAQFAPLAAQTYAQWRKTLYRLWLLRAIKMRCQGLLQDQWLQAGDRAYYGDAHGGVSLFPELIKHAAGVALACFKERQSLRRQSFRVAGLAEIDDPIFR